MARWKSYRGKNGDAWLERYKITDGKGFILGNRRPVEQRKHSDCRSYKEDGNLKSKMIVEDTVDDKFKAPAVYEQNLKWR